jgi:hypothetical protein
VRLVLKPQLCKVLVPVRSPRWVVDLSGDGPNNVGPPVAPIRDWLVDHGATINGLAITLQRRNDPDVAFRSARATLSPIMRTV